jgi:ATP synthase protein I
VFGVRSKPIRTVLWWQICATGVLGLIAGPLGGSHAAVSALLGGLVSILAGWVYAAVGALGGSKQSAGSALLRGLRAEAAKILAIVAGLGVALAAYREVVMLAFLGTFVLATLIFAMAIFVREE